MRNIARAKILRRNRPIGLLAAALSLGSCGNITAPLDFGEHLVSITISGDTVVQVGDSVRLSVYGHVGGPLGMFLYDRVLDAKWAVSDPTSASIVPVKLATGDTTSGSTIVLTGLRPATVQVAATARGVKGEVSIHVEATP